MTKKEEIVAEDKKTETPPREDLASPFEEAYRGWWGRLRTNRFVKEQLFGAGVAGVLDAFFHIEDERSKGDTSRGRQVVEKKNDQLGFWGVLAAVVLVVVLVYTITPRQDYPHLLRISAIVLVSALTICYLILVKMVLKWQDVRRKTKREILDVFETTFPDLTYDKDGKPQLTREDFTLLIEKVKKNNLLGDSEVNNLVADLARQLGIDPVSEEDRETFLDSKKRSKTNWRRARILLGWGCTQLKKIAAWFWTWLHK